MKAATLAPVVLTERLPCISPSTTDLADLRRRRPVLQRQARTDAEVDMQADGLSAHTGLHVFGSWQWLFVAIEHVQQAGVEVQGGSET